MKLKDAGSTRKFARLWIFSRTAQRRHLRSTQRWRVGGCPVGGTPISSQGLPIRPSTSADVPTEAPLWIYMDLRSWWLMTMTGWFIWMFSWFLMEDSPASYGWFLQLWLITGGYEFAAADWDSPLRAGPLAMIFQLDMAKFNGKLSPKSSSHW